MKKTMFLVSLTVVLGLVLVGCPQPTDGGSGNGGFEDYTTKVETGSIGMKAITGGDYEYQGTEGGDVDLREYVTVADFYLGETEVTQGQWEEVMGTEWPGTDDGEVPNDTDGLGDERPAYYISWYDAVEFCNALTRAELKEDDVVYYMDANNNGTYEADTDTEAVTSLNNKGNVVANPEALGYRLPTEVEWEYAAGWEENEKRNSHAGVNITTDESDPNDLDGDGVQNEADGIDDNDPTIDLRAYAWYWMNNDPSGSKVVGTTGTNTSGTAKSGNANALGLYDMSGNVGEWCYDRVSDGSVSRVYRGGSWKSGASNCQVAYGYSFTTVISRRNNLGLRVARNAN